MNKLNYIELGDAITAVYLDNEKYQVNKHVPEFKKDGKYVGDFFNFTMCELDGENPPTFYHIYSPYDIISGKSSQQAAVLYAGEVVMSLEFTPYMLQRTGVMTSLVLRNLGFGDLADKKVVFLGTGRIAQHDLEALKSFYPDLTRVACVSPDSDSANTVAFTALAKSLDIAVDMTSMDHIGDFDVIICHTNSKTPVLTSEMVSSIKQGAVITAFSSEDFTEVSPEFYDTLRANVLIDWDQTVDEAPELASAVSAGKADRQQLIALKSLFQTGIPEPKQYTIYRSHGTPMQNLAALQLLRGRE